MNRCKKYQNEAFSIKDLVSDPTNVYMSLNNIDVALNPNLNDHSDMPNSQQDQLIQENGLNPKSELHLFETLSYRFQTQALSLEIL